MIDKIILDKIIIYMEIAEEMEQGLLTSYEKKEYVVYKMKHLLNFKEAEAIIETIISLSLLDRKININNLNKYCK